VLVNRNGPPVQPDLAKAVEVAPGVRLWTRCSGTGPVALADGGLAIPTQAWAGVRKAARAFRFCAFDRAGVGRSDVRACRCGTLERNVADIHALIRAARVERPLILVGHSTGGLDALLYARRYRRDIAGLVLVDSPSESSPAPLADGRTRLDFASGLRRLRHGRRLGHLPIVILSHGQRSFSTAAAERSWTGMQRQLADDSSNTLRVVARDGGHVIQADQPALVAAAVAQMVSALSKNAALRCTSALRAAGGRCVG
jgi:pimeloyl-ACP methyl ester carboxylesterase